MVLSKDQKQVIINKYKLNNYLFMSFPIFIPFLYHFLRLVKFSGGCNGAEGLKLI